MAKARIALKARHVRKKDLARIHDFDLVVVFREALFTRSQSFERGVHAAGVPMLVDYDDAIWIKDVSPGNRLLSALKDPGKLARVLPLCAGATAGNAYLANFAKKYTPQVHVIPSTVDCSLIFPRPKPTDTTRPLVIGWSGSPTTLPHVEALYPVFETLRSQHGERIAFHVVGASEKRPAPNGVCFFPWKAEQENDRLNAFDIGIMPLPDTAWTRGKCGMKLLLYLAAGLPVVASPVGVNAEMTVGHGQTASSESEWVAALNTLLASADKRNALGKAGHDYVVANYSRQAWAKRYVDIYRGFIHKS